MGRALQVAERARMAFPCPTRAGQDPPPERHGTPTSLFRLFLLGLEGVGAGHDDLRTPADRDHRRGRDLEAAVRRQPQAEPR